MTGNCGGISHAIAVELSIGLQRNRVCNQEWNMAWNNSGIWMELRWMELRWMDLRWMELRWNMDRFARKMACNGMQ